MSIIPQPNSKTTKLEGDFLDQNPRLLRLSLIVLFLIAGLIRVWNLQAPGILIEREYTSAIFARDFYFESNPEVEPWRVEIAEITRERQPVLEPPVTELLVSTVYKLLDQENLIYARFFTIFFWLMGGVLMYRISRVLLPASGAFFATTYYLLVPSGVLVSRSFQPDALMMMLFLGSLYLILMYFKNPSQKSLVYAALLTSLTLLLRPLVFFSIFSAFSALMIAFQGRIKAIFSKSYWVFCGLALTLPVAYYGYEILITDNMRWKVDSSFRPFLFLQVDFWQEWLSVGVHEIGFIALVVALVGFFLVQNKNLKSLIIGLSVGYILFGFVFTYHIHTHGYYHIQFIPAVGLSAASMVTLIVNSVRQSSPKYWWVPVGLVFVFMGYFGLQQIKESEFSAQFENPKIAAEIGGLINHSSRTVFIAYHYGLPLEYYGELSGTFWPRSNSDEYTGQPNERSLSVAERITKIGFVPEYFVVTNFPEYRSHHMGLNDYLKTHCSEFIQTDDYLIFSECQL